MIILSLLLFPPFFFLLAAAVARGLSDLVEAFKPHDVPTRSAQSA